jgi:hypothetical protein
VDRSDSNGIAVSVPSIKVLKKKDLVDLCVASLKAVSYKGTVVAIYAHHANELFSEIKFFKYVNLMIVNSP